MHLELSIKSGSSFELVRRFIFSLDCDSDRWDSIFALVLRHFPHLLHKFSNSSSLGCVEANRPSTVDSFRPYKMDKLIFSVCPFAELAPIFLQKKKIENVLPLIYRDPDWQNKKQTISMTSSLAITNFVSGSLSHLYELIVICWWQSRDNYNI